MSVAVVASQLTLARTLPNTGRPFNEPTLSVLGPLNVDSGDGFQNSHLPLGSNLFSSLSPSLSLSSFPSPSHIVFTSSLSLHAKN